MIKAKDEKFVSFCKFHESSSLCCGYYVMYLSVEVIICAPDSSLICLLGSLDISIGPFVTTRKAPQQPWSPPPPHPTPLFSFNNPGLHETSFMFRKSSDEAGRDSLQSMQRHTPPPSLPSASWPQPRPRHQRQVE